MSSGDRYLALAGSAPGGWLLRRLGLPRPLPLVRTGDRAPSRPVLVGATGAARLLPAVADRFALDRVASFYHPDVAGWRPLAETRRLMTARFGDRSGRLGALLFDASGIETVVQTEALHRFFHDAIRSVAPNGRIVVLSTPPEAAADAEAAAVQRGLEGFVRSLAKEARRAITAQLVQVAPGAEAGIGSTLRFLLSPGSAYVSGQVVRIAAAPPPPPAGGRTVLVTGAARGIGAAIAALFASGGDRVLALDVPAASEALEETARRISGEALPLDITDAGAPAAILAEASRCGGFDVVVHNAGITRDRTIARMEARDWRTVLSVNLEAPLRITGALLAGGGMGSGGRIVCVSSINGIAGSAGQTNYALSKAGLIGLVARLAPAAAASRVTINAVAPGFIETGMTAKIPFAIREAGRRLNAMGQGGQPVDVAEAIGWLADPGSGGINGQVIRVCGQSLPGA